MAKTPTVYSVREVRFLRDQFVTRPTSTCSHMFPLSDQSLTRSAARTFCPLTSLVWSPLVLTYMMRKPLTFLEGETQVRRAELWSTSEKRRFVAGFSGTEGTSSHRIKPPGSAAWSHDLHFLLLQVTETESQSYFFFSINSLILTFHFVLNNRK